MTKKKNNKCMIYMLEGELANIVHTDDSVLGAELIYAIRKGNIGKVSSLIKLGIDINKKNIDGWSALTYAVFKGCVGIVKLLVDNGANVNNIDEYGCSVLAKSLPCQNDPVINKKYMHIGAFLASKGAKYINNGTEFSHITRKFLYNDW
jgi:hypothetical protein